MRPINREKSSLPDHDKVPPAGAALVVEEIREGTVYELDGLRVTAFDVDHGPVKPAFGYRVDYGDRVVVISGDTGYRENLIRHALGADVLVHNVIAADFLRSRLADDPERAIRNHGATQHCGAGRCRVHQSTTAPRRVFAHCPGCGDGR